MGVCVGILASTLRTWALATARFGQLALSLRRGTTLDTLAAGDLLLTFRDIVQVLGLDVLTGVLLRLGSGPTFDGVVASGEPLLGLRDR